MKRRVLKVEDVTVNTAVITVQVMKLDRRQVTMAVFRQLPEVDPLTAEGEWFGRPWGLVRYCPGKECRRGGPESVSHDHLVLEKDGVLYRAALRAPGTVEDAYKPSPYYGWRWDNDFYRAMRVDSSTMRWWEEEVVEKRLGEFHRLPQLFIAT